MTPIYDTTTEAQRNEFADVIFKKITEETNFLYLKDRWADESEYEDFNEYKKVIKTQLEKLGFKFISATKGFKIKFSWGDILYDLKINLNSVNLKWTKAN